MTAAGLILTAIALALLVALELAHAGVAGLPAGDDRRLNRAVAVACVAWVVVTVVQVARYLE
jgi:hypothetical protein